MNKKLNSLFPFFVIIVVLAIGFWIMNDSSNSSKTSTNSNSRISLSTNPTTPQLGENTFIIAVKDLKNQPVKNAKVYFDLNMTQMNMGTQNGEATPQGDGTYAATGRLTMKGPWKVSTKVTMPDGKILTGDFTIDAQ